MVMKSHDIHLLQPQQRCLSDMWLPKDGGEITCSLCPHMTSYRVVPLRLPKHRLFLKKNYQPRVTELTFLLHILKIFKHSQ